MKNSKPWPYQYTRELLAYQSLLLSLSSSLLSIAIAVAVTLLLLSLSLLSLSMLSLLSLPLLMPLSSLSLLSPSLSSLLPSLSSSRRCRYHRCRNGCCCCSCCLLFLLLLFILLFLLFQYPDNCLGLSVDDSATGLTCTKCPGLSILNTSSQWFFKPITPPSQRLRPIATWLCNYFVINKRKFMLGY